MFFHTKLNLRVFIMKIETYEKKEIDIYICADENLEIILTKRESEELMRRLKRGPNEKTKKFKKEAKELYEENKKKVEVYFNNL